MELQLAQGDGSSLSLASLRGKPLLLFLFATFDDGSQLALTPLETYLQRHPDLQVVGIALQPDAESFVEPYRQALGVSFPMGYDPRGSVLAGHSGLGKIPAIPCYFKLDARGHPVDRHVGMLEDRALDAFLTDR